MSSTAVHTHPVPRQSDRGPYRVDADRHGPEVGRRESTLRLTRRGRAVVVLVVLMAAFATFALRSAPAASTDVVNHPRTSTVVVTPGETVWDIARRASPGSDPRSVVAEIERLNSLSDAGSIRVGEPLFVPRD